MVVVLRSAGGAGGEWLLLGELQHFELAAHHRGVGEGLELAEEVFGGGELLGVGFEGFQPRGGEVDEVVVLVLEFGGGEACGLGSAGECAEVDVGGDIAVAGGVERVVAGGVFGEGAQGACGAVGGIVFVGRVAVVEDQEVGVGEAGGGCGDPEGC